MKVWDEVEPRKVHIRRTIRKIYRIHDIQNGIEVNPDKVKVVLGMHPSKSIKDMRRLNGRITALNQFV